MNAREQLVRAMTAAMVVNAAKQDELPSVRQDAAVALDALKAEGWQVVKLSQGFGLDGSSYRIVEEA